MKVALFLPSYSVFASLEVYIGIVKNCRLTCGWERTKGDHVSEDENRRRFIIGLGDSELQLGYELYDDWLQNRRGPRPYTAFVPW